MSQKTLPKSMNESEFSLLIKHTLKLHHKISFLLGFASGLRVSEVVFLKPEDIDLKGKKIFIRQGKGSKDRIVPLPKSFKSKFLKEIPIKCGVRSLQRAFKSACLRANLKPELTFHSLRHSFALHLLENGMPLNQVQLFLGHANIKTTSIYVRANPVQALKSYDKFF